MSSTSEERLILGAMRRALGLARDYLLDVRLVSYDGRVSAGVKSLVEEFGSAAGTG